MNKIFDYRNPRSRIDTSPTSDHNYVYVTPVEANRPGKLDNPATQGLHGWRQNIFLLPAVLFPHSEKA